MCAQRLICVWNRRSKESPLDAWNILRPPPHPLCTCASSLSRVPQISVEVTLPVGNAPATVLLL